MGFFSPNSSPSNHSFVGSSFKASIFSYQYKSFCLASELCILGAQRSITTQSSSHSIMSTSLLLFALFFSFQMTILSWLYISVVCTALSFTYYKKSVVCFNAKTHAILVNTFQTILFGHKFLESGCVSFNFTLTVQSVILNFCFFAFHFKS